MKSLRSSEGVALITALLIVALTTVAATTFATQQQLNIRRTGNLIDGDQAWAYAEAGEAWAKLILRRDLKDDLKEKNYTDDLTEAWAQPLSPINLPGGHIVSTIRDAQARLNLNNLVMPDPNAEGNAQGETNTPTQAAASVPQGLPDPQGSQANPVARKQLQRLLIALQLDPNLAHAVVDWMDQDINPYGPYGAEDDYYSRLKHPYRTANQPMRSVSELRLVKGFNEKAYQRIAPYVTALPTHTAINVNTAPAEVLATLGTIDPKVAVELTKIRQDNPFKTIDEFQQDLKSVYGGATGETLSEGADVKTQYFHVTVDTRIGYGHASLVSVLSREEQGDIRTELRAQGVL